MSSKGPVQQEMESLLGAAFPDANFVVNNDSASHHGQLIKSSTAKGTAKKTIRNTM